MYLTNVEWCSAAYNRNCLLSRKEAISRGGAEQLRPALCNTLQHGIACARPSSAPDRLMPALQHAVRWASAKSLPTADPCPTPQLKDLLRSPVARSGQPTGRRYGTGESTAQRRYGPHTAAISRRHPDLRVQTTNTVCEYDLAAWLDVTAKIVPPQTFDTPAELPSVGLPSGQRLPEFNRVYCCSTLKTGSEGPAASITAEQGNRLLHGCTRAASSSF